ncbi:MAG: hypothetical protein NVS4B3_07910 [Gemmatimonadaceae bacterium]
MLGIRERIQSTHRWAAVLLASATVACTDVMGPKLPPARRFDPPVQYQTWWLEVEECSAHVAPLERVSFYRVVPEPGRDSVSFRDPETQQYFHAEWVRASNAIYLAAGQVTSPQIVRHEMLHAVLHDITHPAEYFTDRCGKQVSY